MQIAIAGYGLEGKASLKYFRAKFPQAEFTIFDERVRVDDLPNFAKFIGGKNALAKITPDFDLVLRTAGLAPHKILQRSDAETTWPDGISRTAIWSSTREFFAVARAKQVKIIGVTGSKGKGTTCSFIYEILRAHFTKNTNVRETATIATNPQIFLVGNIGKSPLDIIAKLHAGDLVVFELSSFQLWDLTQSPDIAVMTLIEPDHLDVHADFAEYVAAKSRIFQFQRAGDVAVYNETDALVRETAETFASMTGAESRPFLNKKFTHIQQGKFYYNTQEICETSVVKLPGEHNLRNAAAAINATWEIVCGDVAAIWQGLANFHGLPHRLKFVCEISLGTSGGANRVKFYDDSIATTPGSAIAALNSFREPKILILGGHDKGADYREIGREIAKLNCENRGENNESSVRGVVIYGANRVKIAQQLRKTTDVKIIEINTDRFARDRQKIQTDAPENCEKLLEISRDVMSEVVGAASKIAKSGDVVILSPAAASFDLFNSYAERGDLFALAVKNLVKNEK